MVGFSRQSSGFRKVAVPKTTIGLENRAAGAILPLLNKTSADVRIVTSVRGQGS